MKPATATGGFTLVEVAVATIVAIIGLAGAMSMSVWQLKATRFNERSSEAVAAGQELMENLIQDPYNNLVDGTATNGNFNLSWTVGITNRCKTVDLIVSWQTGNGTQQITMRDLHPDDQVNGYIISN